MCVYQDGEAMDEEVVCLGVKLCVCVCERERDRERLCVCVKMARL